MAKKKDIPVKAGEPEPPAEFDTREWLRRMDEDFEQLRALMSQDFWWPRHSLAPRTRRARMLGWQPMLDVRHPLLDIRDTGKKIVIEAEMAGIAKENIGINLTENSIEICGEIEEREDMDNEGYFRRERSYTTCYRQVPLPAEVVPTKAFAELEDGILRVEVPKRKPTSAKGHKVKIK